MCGRAVHGSHFRFFVRSRQSWREFGVRSSEFGDLLCWEAFSWCCISSPRAFYWPPASLYFRRSQWVVFVGSQWVVFAVSPPFPLKSRHSRHILYSCGFPAVLKSTQNHSCGGFNSPGAPLFMRLWRLWRLFGDIWGGNSERRRLQTMPICSLSECCHLLLESFGGGRSRWRKVTFKADGCGYFGTFKWICAA
jgi:hypothetical protein